MKEFSARRMLLFTRLQIGEMYGLNIWRTVLMAFSSVLIICLLSLLFEDDLAESISFAEIPLLVIAMMQVSTLFSDLLTSRMTVPASPLEKYVSLYVGSIALAVPYLLFSALWGSAIFAIVSLVTGDAEGMRLLFLGGRHDSEHVLTMIALTFYLLPLVVVFSMSKKIFGRRSFLLQVLVVAVILLTPIVLEETDVIGEKASTVLLIAMLVVSAVIFLIYAYRSFLKYQMDSRENE